VLLAVRYCTTLPAKFKLLFAGFYCNLAKKEGAENETEAYKQAEEEMEKKAANDSALLVQAQQRVQSLLEDYVKNMGEVLGKEYTITWDIKENHVKPDTAESTE